MADAIRLPYVLGRWSAREVRFLTWQATSLALMKKPVQVLQSRCMWSLCRESCHRIWMLDWMQLVWLCLPRYLMLWMIHCQSTDKRNQSIKVSLSASPALGALRLQRDPAPCSSCTQRARTLRWGGDGNWSCLHTLCRVKSKLTLSPSAAFKSWAAGQQERGRDCLLPSGKEWINTAGKIFLLLSNCKT